VAGRRSHEHPRADAPGTRADVEILHDDIAIVLAPLGLRLSPAKTRIVHMSEPFDFLGFRIQWKRKRGTNKRYVYTFIADRPIRSLKGQGACPQQVVAAAARRRADPAQSDHARLGQLLQEGRPSEMTA
jgi:hypothetical protein